MSRSKKDAAAEQPEGNQVVVAGKWDTFPSEPPTEALAMIYDAWRGNHVDQDDAVLAGFNVAGYAYGKGFAKSPVPPAPVPGGGMFARPKPTKEEVEAAFKAALPDEDGTMMAGDPAQLALPWGVILPIVGQLLAQWLHIG